MNKKALSIIEIIISVTILILFISIVLSYKDSYDENKFNTKIQSDLKTLNNSLLSFKQEK
jgi:hypothetical protein